MKQLLIIDINGLGYAAMYQPALASLSFNGKSTAALHGATASVISLIKKFPTFTPIVLWDGRSKWRYDLVPEYKSNRSDDAAKTAIRVSYAQQVPHIKRLLHAAGIPQLDHPDCEADDLAGILCRTFGDVKDGVKDVDMVMASKDTDWWQGLNHNVIWYSNLSDTAYSLADLMTDKIKDGPFSSTKQYVQAKAMAGDISDTIPGIPGIGLKTAAKMLEQYGSIEALWALYDAGEVLKGQRLISVAGPDYRARYQTNLRMIDWSAGEKVNLDLLLSTYDKADHTTAQNIGQEFNMKNLMGMIRSTGALPDYNEDLNYLLASVKNDGSSPVIPSEKKPRVFKF